jgi:hypothetical protein
MAAKRIAGEARRNWHHDDARSLQGATGYAGADDRRGSSERQAPADRAALGHVRSTGAAIAAGGAAATKDTTSVIASTCGASRFIGAFLQQGSRRRPPTPAAARADNKDRLNASECHLRRRRGLSQAAARGRVPDVFASDAARRRLVAPLHSGTDRCRPDSPGALPRVDARVQRLWKRTCKAACFSVAWSC